MEHDFRIRWKGSSDAVERMSRPELERYVSLLQSALEAVGSHFAFTGSGFHCEKMPRLGDPALFGGSIESISEKITRAVLRMYEVNRTRFVPVPMPGRCNGNFKNAG